MEAEGKDFEITCADDGRPLAEYIKYKFCDTRFNCTVEITDLADTCKNLKIDGNSIRPVAGKVAILIVSPSFLSFANASEMVPYDVLFPMPEKTVALLFYVDVPKPDQVVKGLCDNAKRWTLKDAGNSKEALRECLVTLITILEEDGGAPLPVLKKFRLMPSTVTWNVDKVYIIFTQETHGKVEILQNNEKLEAVFNNPYTYVFTPVGHYCGNIEVEVLINGSPAGKESLRYMSTTEELEHLLTSITDPLNLLCTAVSGEGSSVGMLDQTMNHMFCNSCCVVSPNLDVTNVNTDTDGEREQEYPTLLHLVARYGLKNTCNSILDTPGGKLAVKIKNKDGLTPVAIATKYEHHGLAKSLQESSSVKTQPSADEDNKLEAYCDMEMESSSRRMKEVRPRRTGQYDLIDNIGKVPDVQRSVSSPAATEQSTDVYMDMVIPQVRFRSRIGPKNEKQKPKAVVPEVTRRQRSRTADSSGSRESARISLLLEDDIKDVPRLPRRNNDQERIYTSIRDVPQSRKMATNLKADILNFRKS